MNYVKNPLDSKDSKNRYLAVWDKTENVKGIAIIWRDHFLEENVGLLNALVRMGVEPKDILAIDKGDKAIYKARTGALKSFFANTFWVATHDDPERDDNDKKPSKASAKTVSNKTVMISDNQKALIKNLFRNNVDELNTILHSYGKKKIDELSISEASDVIKSKKEGIN